MKLVKMVLEDKFVKMGVSGNRSRCPVALMLREYINEKYEITVGNVYIIVFDNDKNQKYSFTLPQKLIHFVNNFDSNKIDYHNYVPIEVELKLPEDVLK